LTNDYNATGQRVQVAATIGTDPDFITTYVLPAFLMS
jgi:hypothetical protein